MLKNDVVEFKQDYSVVVGSDRGRVDVLAGTRAIVVRGTDEGENKIDCVVVLPRFKNGLDINLTVATWALSLVDAPELVGIWKETSNVESKRNETQKHQRS